jgi:hypothetical protein
MDVGKLAIAYCLIPFENEAKLYQPLRGGNWYEYLAGKLDSVFEEFGNNRLSIITFNYDRSLEHYLLNYLINLHGKSPDECARALEQIPIVHVYGQLGEKPYPQPGCFRYRPDQLKHFIYVKTAAAGIKLYHEEAETSSASARELLKRARRVCFLGFGYHSFNLARLNIGGLSTYQRRSSERLADSLKRKCRMLQIGWMRQSAVQPSLVMRTTYRF